MSMGGITIDRRTDADTDDVLDLVVKVFDDSPREWVEAGICDPPYPESIGFVARAGGRIVSHVEVMDMPLQYGDATVHTGAITGVVTLPEWQRRGLASALMNLAAAEMTQRSWPLGVLLTGSQGFYERLGWCRWMPPGRMLDWSDAAALAKTHLSDGYTAAPYSESDLPEMMDLHARYNEGRPGTLPRPERYWRSIIKRRLEVTEYPDQYCAIHRVRHEGRLAAYGFTFVEDGVLYLGEVAYDDEAAVPSLLRALIQGADDAAPASLVATVPWDNAALRWIDSTGRSLPSDLDTIMWRINDLAGLLRQVQPILEGRLGGRGDGELILAFDRGVAKMEARNGALKITDLGLGPVPTMGQDLPICAFSQADLLTLLLGSYESPEWLDGMGIPGETRGMIETLFPPAGGIFWLTDNF